MKPNGWWKAGGALVLLGVVLQIVPAQNTPAPAAPKDVLPMAEVQQLRIQVKRDALELWQKDFAQVIANIKRENGWEDDVLYDFTYNVFYRVPKPKATEAAPGKR